MIFESIEIENLFSYHGTQKFENLKTTAGKPIIIISGRNGYGKTSFINSIKLLFLGTNKEMLADAQVGRSLRPTGYLLGLDHAWQGAFNRDARNGNAKQYGVKIVWHEEKGVVTAHRYWEYDGGEPSAFLRIETDFMEDGLGNSGSIIDPEEAEEFLQRRLPREVVSFFFYDGEKIQALAEANEQGRMKQIEKLVGLAAVDTADEYLKIAIAEWKRGGTMEHEQAELDVLRAQNSTLLASRATAQVKRDDLEADLDNLERDIKKHERYITNTRNLADQSQSPRLKEKLEVTRSEYENMCVKIGANLPAIAPILAAPSLIERISLRLDEATGSSSRQLAEEMSSIFSTMPNRLFDEPPHASPQLSVNQKNHYKTKLGAILKQYTEPSSSGYFSLSSRESALLQKRINYFAQAQQERSRQIEDLQSATKLYREWQSTKSELESTDELAPEQKQIFKQRQEELRSFKTQRDDLLKSIGAVSEKLTGLETEIVRMNAEIAAQETKRVKAGINSELISRAEQARRVFDLYGHRLKAQRRAQIEEALNRCFDKLMSSHKLISRIELNDSFALRYLDQSGNDIGLANISAGMKQLAAQALLWALSEASGLDIPIVVDTPLARIDREHQENLLVSYYPNAGPQVFMLPTNAELDSEKYFAIKAKTAAEFKLINNAGDQTTVQSGANMYQMDRI